MECLALYVDESVANMSPEEVTKQIGKYLEIKTAHLLIGRKVCASRGIATSNDL